MRPSRWRKREIIYQAPAVKIDVSSKETRIGKAEIESRPVTDVQGLLAKQPGFKVDPEGQMHVRGGRSSDMLVKVDGVDFRDPLVCGSRNSVNMSALNVEEIEVLTGGDARYGGFQSALVNVSTPEGNPARYGGIIEWRTDRAFKTYSFNTDRYDYSLSGPVPFADKLLGSKKAVVLHLRHHPLHRYLHSLRRQPQPQQLSRRRL